MGGYGARGGIGREVAGGGEAAGCDVAIVAEALALSPQSRPVSGECAQRHLSRAGRDAASAHQSSAVSSLMKALATVIRSGRCRRLESRARRLNPALWS